MLEVGDLVRAVPPFCLACGSGIYREAAVVSVSPLILTSEDADMLWMRVKPHEIVAVGRAAGPMMTKGVRRLIRDIRDYRLPTDIINQFKLLPTPQAATPQEASE